MDMPYRTVTVCAALIAASAFMQAADAQPLPHDPERFRMIEQCLELTFGRSGGNYTHHMYKACMEDHAITTLHAAPETAADSISAERQSQTAQIAD
jgi:hypothetical protein